MSFPYLTTAAGPSDEETSQRAEETVVKSEPSEETTFVPINYTTSSSSPSRAASPTIELYTVLYNTLSNRAHTLADELERDGTAQVKVEVERELAVKREGEKMKRKRSSSVDRSERDLKTIKIEEVLSESISTTSSTLLEKSGQNKEKAEEENLEKLSTTTSHRRRSSLPSLPKPIFSPAPRISYKKPLFSLDTFLRESNSNPSSTRTSPVLSAAQLPHPLHLTTHTISIPLTRSYSNGEDCYIPTITHTTRKVELSSVVRSFEKVLKERAEGWKRLEEVEERWAARAVDDWHF